MIIYHLRRHHHHYYHHHLKEFSLLFDNVSTVQIFLNFFNTRLISVIQREFLFYTEITYNIQSSFSYTRNKCVQLNNTLISYPCLRFNYYYYYYPCYHLYYYYYYYCYLTVVQFLASCARIQQSSNKNILSSKGFHGQIKLGNNVTGYK